MLLCVLLPSLAAAAYLWGFAADQYASEFRFSVRREAPIGASAGIGGAAASILGGGNPMLALTHDGQVVVQYLRSRQAMDDVGAALDLGTMLGRAKEDVWERLDPSDPAEDRLRHWRRFVRPRFELTSGIVVVEVSAFAAADAMAIAQASLGAAERLVNGISARARADAVAFARDRAQRTGAAYADAQQRLTDYRNTHGLLSPTLAAGAGSGLEGQINEQLAQARAQLATLRATFMPTAPPVRLQEQRVSALEAELRAVQDRMAAPAASGDATLATLATLASGHDTLQSAERLAQAEHERALAALSAAEAQAAQQSAYLDAFVRPALAERPSYPIRWFVLLQVAGWSLVAWAILSLLLQAIRDHVD